MKNEVKVGILVLISGVLLYFGYHFLKGNDLLSNESVYQVRYAKVDGLQVSSSILVNGHRVGQVEDIEIEHDKNDSLLISLRVKAGIQVGDSSVAVLLPGNPLGGQSIKLNLGRSTVFYTGGEFLQAQVEKGLMVVILEQMQAMQVIGNKVAVLTNENSHLVVKVRSILDNVDKTTKHSGQLFMRLDASYARQQKNIESVIENFKHISSEFKSLPDSLKIAISEASILLDSLNNVDYSSLVDNIDSVMVNMQQITGQLIDSNNSVGALLNDKEMYNNLNKTIEDLDFVLVDFQANPSKYTSISIFGKQPENEKPIIKSVKPKIISTELVLKLKREIPAMFKISLYETEKRTILNLNEDTFLLDRGTKTITASLPADITQGTYILHATWLGASSGESITIVIQ
jgi:phospholipid/cholesterol/gamma-HCH transport system substrate-binding protein